MDDNILTLYCLCADVVKATGHTDAPQQRMSDADVISTGLVALGCVRGNFESARARLRAPRYIPHMLSRSRVNRRLHRLKELLLRIFKWGGETWKHLNIGSVYIIDRFPMAVCDSYRIPRVKLYKHEVYRGYIASKKRYFYGLNIHLMVTKGGQPVECFLTPGSSSDVRALQPCRFDVPEGSQVYANKAYHDYAMEDVGLEAAHIQLYPIRTKHSTRTLPPSIAYVQHDYRKRIDTVGSLLERMLPNTIHAVTAAGFVLKVFLFVLAYSMNCL